MFELQNIQNRIAKWCTDYVSALWLASLFEQNDEHSVIIHYFWLNWVRSVSCLCVAHLKKNCFNSTSVVRMLSSMAKCSLNSFICFWIRNSEYVRLLGLLKMPQFKANELCSGFDCFIFTEIVSDKHIWWCSCSRQRCAAGVLSRLKSQIDGFLEARLLF